ncbi:hypothetical protein AYR46_07470 [Sphingobium yanoikuyae]|nr:hypothetical protein AYR46_07470 [Sphingobium yanoikuyae]
MVYERSDAWWQRPTADMDRMYEFKVARIIVFQQWYKCARCNFFCDMEQAHACDPHACKKHLFHGLAIIDDQITRDGLVEFHARLLKRP